MTKDTRGRKSDLDRVERVRAMRKLKAAGWTWARIGKRYGMSRQAASQAVKRADRNGLK